MKFRTLAAKDPSPNRIAVIVNPGYGGTARILAAVMPSETWEYRFLPDGEWVKVKGQTVVDVEGLEPDTVYDVEARRCTG